MFRHLVVGLTVLCTALVANGAALPSCSGTVAVAGAHFQRLEKDGTITLSDGRTVHLEGIRLPAGAADRAPLVFADRALAAIAALAQSGPITLTVIAPREDRYGRLRAQIFIDGRWLQKEILVRGLARVAIAPDRTDCAVELFAAEASARDKHTSLWLLPAYAIRTPQTVRRDIGTFQIVEGRVLNVSVKNGRAYLNFGADWHTDFTATIDPIDMPNFRASGVNPEAYAGQIIRVRGWVQSLNGPEIEVANPQGIEVVQ